MPSNLVTPDTAETASTLAPHDKLRLYRVLGRMPYGDGLRTRDVTEMTVDSLITALEGLVDRLTEHGRECEARDAKLREHEELLRAGRRIFAALAGPQG